MNLELRVQIKKIPELRIINQFLIDKKIKNFIEISIETNEMRIESGICQLEFENKIGSTFFGLFVSNVRRVGCGLCVFVFV